MAEHAAGVMCRPVHTPIDVKTTSSCSRAVGSCLSDPPFPLHLPVIPLSGLVSA